MPGTQEPFEPIHDSDRAGYVPPELVTAVHQQGTVEVVVHAHAGHLAPGLRRELIDALLDSPDAAGSERLSATIPLGDAESLLELTARCDEITVRAAGVSAIVEGRLHPWDPARDRT
jgi:hypothetical protein